MEIVPGKLIAPVGTALTAAVILLIIRGISFGLLHKWAEKTTSKIDGIILSALKAPSIYWCLAMGLYIGAEVSDIPKHYVYYFSKSIHIIVIFSVTIATANLAGKVFRNYVQK